MVPNVGEEVYITVKRGFEDVTYGPVTVTQVDDPIPPNDYGNVHVTIDGVSIIVPSAFVYRNDPLLPPAANDGNPQSRLRPGHRTFEFKHL